MKNLALVMVLMLATAGALLAQDEETPATTTGSDTEAMTFPFMFSFVPGVSIPPRPGATPVINKLHFGYLGNYCNTLEGFGLSSVLDIVQGELHGGQVSGIANLVISNLKVSLSEPWSYGSSEGCQVAGILNLAAGTNPTWFQVAGIANGQLGDMSGGQFAGLGNCSFGAFSGAQVAGLANVHVGAIEGVQVAGLGNVAIGDLSGAQVSSLGNVLIGKVSGAQVGLFNFAMDVDGAQVGLFNINLGGELWVDVGYDEMNMLAFSIRHGTKYFYNYYSTAFETDSFDTALSFPYFGKSSLGVGMGARYPFSDLLAAFLEIGVTSVAGKDSQSWDDIRSAMLENRVPDSLAARAQIYTARLGISYTLGQYLSLVAGVSYNYALPTDKNRALLPSPLFERFPWSDNTNVQWPGFYVAVRF
jgi:hypothetical protein